MFSMQLLAAAPCRYTTGHHAFRRCTKSQLDASVSRRSTLEMQAARTVRRVNQRRVQPGLALPPGAPIEPGSASVAAVDAGAGPAGKAATRGSMGFAESMGGAGAAVWDVGCDGERCRWWGRGG